MYGSPGFCTPEVSEQSKAGNATFMPDTSSPLSFWTYHGTTMAETLTGFYIDLHVGNVKIVQEL